MAVELHTNSVEHYALVLNYLASSYEKEEYSDLAFVCKGGKVIKAHQLVLASVSPFLRELFNESTMPEVSISLSEVDYHLVSELLTLMYEGTMKLLASDIPEFKKLIQMLGIEFPGGMHIGGMNIEAPIDAHNGIEDTPSSSAMTVLPISSVGEVIETSTVGGPNDDPLNIPDRYFAKPKTAASGQPNVKPVQPKTPDRRASTSEKNKNKRLRESSKSPSRKLSTEGRASHTRTFGSSRETFATDEGTSQSSTSNGLLHYVATSSSDSSERSDPGGPRKRKRSTENAGEKFTRKKSHSTDKEIKPDIM